MIRKNTHEGFATFAKIGLLAVLAAMSSACAMPCDEEDEIETEECQILLGKAGSLADGSIGDNAILGFPGHWDELDWTTLQLDDVVGPVGNAEAFVITLDPPLVGYACLDPIWEQIGDDDECLDECEGDAGCEDECEKLWEVARADLSVHAATPQYDLLGFDGCPVLGFDQTVNCTTEFAATQGCDVQNYFRKDGSTPVNLIQSISGFEEPQFEQCEFDDGLVIDVLSDEPCDEPSF